MGLLFSLIYIIFAILIAPTAWSQPQPQMSYCLTAAQETEVAAFKKDKKYILEDESLRANLPLGCKGYKFLITLKGTDGFRVTTEIGGETWSVDEKYDFVRLARAGSKSDLIVPTKKDPKEKDKPKTPDKPTVDKSAPAPAPAAGAAPPPPKQDGIFSTLARAAFGGGSGTATNPDGTRVPLAILASDASPPGPPAPPNELPEFKAKDGPGAATVKAKDDGKVRMLECFSKRYYGTKSCADFFTSLDKECGKGGDKVPVQCVEYTRRVSEAQLDDCQGEEENWGKCEEKARVLTKACQNPLKQLTGECRALAKYKARVDSNKPAERGLAQAPGLFEALETTALEAIRNVRTLEPSLRKLLTLRPVSYETKDGNRKDIGFVADEVELIDRNLVSYSPSGKVQGVRYQALTTMLTSGMQDLYGICKSDLDLNRELVRKVILLQDDNAELKKLVERQQIELTLIKNKLGIK